MTAVRPSSARALASGPASSARPATRPGASSSASAFACVVVAADEGVLVRRLLAPEGRRQRASGARRRPARRARPGCARRERRRSSDGKTPAGVKRSSEATESTALRADRECAAPARCRARPRPSSRGRRDRRLATASAFVAPRRAELGCGRGRALEVARADDDVVSGFDEPLRERRAERARPTDDRYPHAASSATSARRRSESRSCMRVAVTTSSTRRLGSRVRLVDHERVDQALVTTCDYGAVRCRPPCAGAYGRVGRRTPCRPTSGLTATQRARRVSIASRIARTARIGPIERNGLLGARRIASAAPSASRTPGRGLGRCLRLRSARRRPRPRGGGRRTTPGTGTCPPA